MTAAPTAAVFLMPRRSDEWANAPAIWVTAAGWAAAAERRFGRAWVVTRDRVATAAETLGFTRPRASGSSTRRRIPLPLVARTAVKDVVRWRIARRHADVGDRPEWAGTELAFVWQQHDLFNRSGEALARRHRCPLVVYVHAPQAWEAKQWGVRRPGWTGFLERHGDRPPLLAADVVACVSEEVAAEVRRLDVDPGRIVVSPMAVDAERFSPEVSGAAVRKRYGLGDSFVVGWTGSFRTFHGLDMVLEAFARFARTAPASRLLLVGDGAGRASIESAASALGIGEQVVMPGAKSGDELPEYVAAMDATVVSAPPGDAFHYSPLKLREYLAVGRPAIAPAVGDVVRTFVDGRDALLYQTGDVKGLADRLALLRDDAELRARLGRAGRELVLHTATWDVRLDDLLGSNAFVAAAARAD